jgi:hypothetical protein
MEAVPEAGCEFRRSQGKGCSRAPAWICGATLINSRRRSLTPIRRNHYLGKSARIAPQIAPPPINLPGDHIPQPRHLANRRKRLRDNRSLLFCAPPPASLRTRQALQPGSSHRLLHRCKRQCLHRARRGASTARARHPRADSYLASAGVEAARRRKNSR